MTVQKILSQQIANSGGTAGQVLVANSTGVTWGDANNATNLGGVAAASYVNTAGAYIRTGVTTFNANAVIGPTGELVFDANSGIYANGSIGTAGQVLTSNGTTVYWTAAAAGTNVAAQYAWTNTHSYSAVVTHTANVSVNGAIIANGGAGTSGQVLTSSAGGNVYWSSVSGGGGFTNGQSISVSNLAVTGVLSANGGVGTAGQALISGGAGNTYWGTSSPGYNYSSQFNGAVGNYLSVGTSSTLALGAGDFTIECWIYPTAWNTNTSGIWDYRTNGGTATNVPCIFLSASGVPAVNFSAPSAAAITGSTALTLNAWNHLALVRSGTSVILYLNGLNIGSTTSSATFGIQTLNINNSISGATNYSQAGYFSNFRIVKGSAVYTSAFTVPTSPLTAITNTVLLTCNAITPTSDSSTNNFAITNNGAVTTTATLSPFTSTTVSIPTASLTAVRQQFTGDGTTTVFNIAGGYTPGTLSVYYNGLMLRNGSDVTATNGATITMAIAPQSGALIDVIGTVPTTYSSITPVSYSTQFNGSSQYLSLTNNTAFAFGTGDFTIECWSYFTSVASFPTISDSRSSSGSTSGFNLGLSTAKVQLYTTSQLLIGTTNLNANQWYHIAITRSGTTLRIFLNGIQDATATNSTNWSDQTFNIGSGPGGVNYMTGYISNFRLVKGVAVYTNNFTVPSSPLAITQSASGPYIQAISGTQTSLLTCNAPTIIDGSTNAFTITNNGSAPVSTAIVPTFTNVTITGYTAPYNANYLIVAGGGGGGASGGGGGGGGMIVGSTLLTARQTYSITVGAGGTGGTSTVASTNGTNSIFNSITAIGGGYGANDSTFTGGGTGGVGGSGGGAGRSTGSLTGGSGVYGQGNAGGNNSTASVYPSGGGGGAGAVGASGSGGTVSGNGGAGGLSYITGSAVYYAGGGGGGLISGTTAGTGGSGGGGNGSISGNGTAGTTNTGGGGGGAYQLSGAVGGAGGSGIVILSVPTINYTGTTTGSPTVTTNGIYTVLTFTASGSYTA